MSLIENFTNDDIEQYLSTVPHYVHWPRGVGAVRLQVLIIPGDRLHLPYARVFRTMTTNVQDYGFVYLRARLKVDFTGQVVFIQNYGPTDTFALQMKEFLAQYSQVQLSIVFVKEYDKNGKDGLPIVRQAGVDVCQISSWRWIAFLLWNRGELNLQWWAMEFRDCAEAIAQGFKACTGKDSAMNQPNQAANPARTDMQDLVIRMGFANNPDGEINVRACTWNGGEKLTLRQYLLSHTDVSYPQDRVDSLATGFQDLSFNQGQRRNVTKPNKVVKKDVSTATPLVTSESAKAKGFKTDRHDLAGIIPVYCPQGKTTIGMIPVLPNGLWEVKISGTEDSEKKDAEVTLDTEVETAGERLPSSTALDTAVFPLVQNQAVSSFSSSSPHGSLFGNFG